MFRPHVTKVIAVLALTLALGLVSVPARAAGFAAGRSSAWVELAGRLFGWLLKSSGYIDPNGGAPSCPGSTLSSDDSGYIDPNGRKASAPAGAATLSSDDSSYIDPNGRH